MARICKAEGRPTAKWGIWLGEGKMMLLLHPLLPSLSRDFSQPIALPNNTPFLQYYLCLISRQMRTARLSSPLFSLGPINQNAWTTGPLLPIALLGLAKRAVCYLGISWGRRRAMKTPIKMKEWSIYEQGTEMPKAC